MLALFLLGPTHHPLADNDVDLVDREGDVLDLALDDTGLSANAWQDGTHVMTLSRPLLRMLSRVLLASPDASMA